MKRDVRRSAGWVPVILLALGLLLGACTRRETDVHRGDREQILYRGIGSEVSDLDPQLVTGLAEQCIVSALFEGLVTEDPHDLHPVPGVAERWEISPDGLTYTFHLRADARWSNGDPVTAHDFTASFRRILSPSLAADNATLFNLVLNAEAFNQGRLADYAQVGFAAPDDRTLRITLAHPTPYFLALLAQMPWLPVPLRVIKEFGAVDQRGNSWTQPGRLVSNGPFVLKTWKPNEVIIVEKSPIYWDAARVRLHAIHFHPIDSQDAEERAFRTGQLHVTYTLPADKIDAYRRAAPQLLRCDPYFNTYFFRLNVRRPPLDNEQVRRALGLAVDRQAIVEHVLHGGQQPAKSLTPPGLVDYTPPAGVATNFAAARQLLAAAGYPGGHGVPPMELLYNNSENHRLLAEAVQEMWRRELGVQVRLVNQELKVVLEARRTGQYQILLSDWVGDYPDASTFLDVWRGDSGNNHTGWASADYDALLRAAAYTGDPAGRAELLRRAESLLLAAMPVVPLYFNTHVFLLSSSVHGWHSTVLDHHPYKYVWLEE
jgi:oligopeptide transport system substrate-binding protein